MKLVRTLQEYGASVAIFDIQAPPGEVLVESVKFYRCDVTDSAQVTKLVRQVENELGDVTTLVNNAGVVSGKSLLELTDTQINKTFQVNTLAQFWTARAVLPMFIERRRGHIVTIASTMGLVAVANMSKQFT